MEQTLMRCGGRLVAFEPPDHVDARRRRGALTSFGIVAATAPLPLVVVVT